MAALSLDDVTKRFGAITAVDSISITVAEGEFIAVVGPSGCGKSTLLRLIAGFEQCDAGTIRLGENVVSGPSLHVVPEDRRIGMVFQSYALWPHMTVGENIGYPLRVQKLRGRELAREIDAALEAVGLAGTARRRPAELSGGQRQRVALARCLAMKARVVLLDEPLANLDVHLRARMLSEIAAFRDVSGATLIYVTHDQADALSAADRVAVMNSGRIHQVAQPNVLYRMPSDGVVSRFVGGGAVVRGQVTGIFGNGHATVALFDQEWHVRSAPRQALGAAEICIRPEDLRIVGNGSGFAAIVRRAMYQGGRTIVETTPTMDSGTTLSLSLPSAEIPLLGSTIRLALSDGWVIPH